jgi:hypothetical protein
VVREQPGDRFVHAQGNAQVAHNRFQIKLTATGGGFSVVKVLSGSGVICEFQDSIYAINQNYGLQSGAQP